MTGADYQMIWPRTRWQLLHRNGRASPRSGRDQLPPCQASY